MCKESNTIMTIIIIERRLLIVYTTENQVVIEVHISSWFSNESVLLESITGLESDFH